MALSQRLIDLVFTRMLVRYGAAWVSKWRGIDEAAVRADWAHELDGLGEAAIRYALDHLPADFPPTASQFKALCINRPEPMPPLLPAPKADPKRVAAELERMRRVQAERQPLQWAYDLQEREKRGDSLSLTQMAAWRVALERAELPCMYGDFKPIPDEYLPPAMRKEAA